MGKGEKTEQDYPCQGDSRRVSTKATNIRGPVRMGSRKGQDFYGTR